MGIAAEAVESLAAKFGVLLPHLDERQQRLYLGSEARSLGHGGIRAVARAAGVSEPAVASGVAELEAGGSRWAGHAGRVGAASGPRTWTLACSRRCWPWSSRRSGATRCRRCGGRPSRPGSWRPS
jgi:hypothetical protein